MPGFRLKQVHSQELVCSLLGCRSLEKDRLQVEICVHFFFGSVIAFCHCIICTSCKEPSISLRSLVKALKRAFVQ